MYYDDWVNNASGEEPVLKLDLGGRDNYVYIIGDVSKPYYKKSQLNRMKKAELVELSEKYMGYYAFSPNDYTKAEMIDELKDISIQKHYEYLASTYSWISFQDKIEHDWYITKGYSQGDAVMIIKVDGELTESYKKYIDNILWDLPISLRIEVDDKEYYEDDFLDDIYEYNKNDVTEKVKNHKELSEYVKEWVIDNLPDYPKSYY
jgi:hypothetical protein